MNLQISTLSNGLRIMTSNRPQTETVTLGIWVKTGAACEREEMNGISHFLEHMVFKGTPKRSSLKYLRNLKMSEDNPMLIRHANSRHSTLKCSKKTLSWLSISYQILC